MPTHLETRLRRGLQATAEDVAPAPRDLADLVRHRARRQRRTRLAVGVAGLAATLVFVGVPVVAATLVADGGGTAAPAARTTPPAPLYDLPTRGSLADDQEWLDAVAALPWYPPDLPPDPSLPDPPVADRRVHYAGEVPSGRVALVVGREGSLVHHLWFTGPAGAQPGEMQPATTPNGTADQGRLALIDAPDPDAEEATLVLVARPGDSAAWAEPPVVEADGSVTTETVGLPLEDGVAVARVPTPTPWTSAIEVTRDGRALTSVWPETSRRLAGDAFPEVQPADPRGLADRLDRSRLGFATANLIGGFGLTAEEADPTLLAAGPLAPEWSEQAWLLGLTFPSGATGLVLEAERQPLGDGSPTGYSYSLPFAPAGTPLLDRVIVVRALGGVVVSAPAPAASVEVLDARGAVLGSVALDQGAGTGPLPVAADTARLLAADGTVVAEVPITSVDG